MCDAPYKIRPSDQAASVQYNKSCSESKGRREDPVKRSDERHSLPLVIVQRNPHSGSGRGRGELLTLTRELQRLNFRVRMFSNRTKLDAYVKTLDSVRPLTCIVAAGGDGTVTDLVNRHPRVPIAILPLGTENLLAKYLGIRRCGRTLAATIHRGRVRVLDSAKADGRRFLLMLSAGVDAEIVEAIHSSRTGNIQRIGYLWPTLRAFIKSRPGLYEATSADGQLLLTGSHLIVTNVPRYGFGLPFSPDARPDDGLLDVRAFRGTTRWQIFWHAVKLKLGLPLRADEVARVIAPEVTIRAAIAANSRVSQCDGDPGPGLPVHVEIEPQSLTLIVP